MTTHSDKEKSVFFSLVIDFLLFIPDIVAAFMANSITLWADVLKCGNELLATFLSWLALRMVCRDRRTDDKHQRPAPGSQAGSSHNHKRAFSICPPVPSSITRSPG